MCTYPTVAYLKRTPYPKRNYIRRVLTCKCQCHGIGARGELWFLVGVRPTVSKRESEHTGPLENRSIFLSDTIWRSGAFRALATGSAKTRTVSI